MDIVKYSIKDCLEKPYLYKLCSRSICIAVDHTCPCTRLDQEFQCRERCIPVQYRCDGRKDCPSGDDEASCGGDSSSAGLDQTTVIALVLGSLFVCAVVGVLLGIYFYRRWRNNEGRMPVKTDVSATSPLKGDHPLEETDSSDRVTYSSDRRYEEDSTIFKPKGTTYFTQKERGRSAYDHVEETDSTRYSSDTDIQENQSDRSKHKPANLKLEREANLDGFANDLLCASTPRQPQRLLVHSTNISSSLTMLSKS